MKYLVLVGALVLVRMAFTNLAHIFMSTEMRKRLLHVDIDKIMNDAGQSEYFASTLFIASVVGSVLMVIMFSLFAVFVDTLWFAILSVLLVFNRLSIFRSLIIWGGNTDDRSPLINRVNVFDKVWSAGTLVYTVYLWMFILANWNIL